MAVLNPKYNHSQTSSITFTSALTMSVFLLDLAWPYLSLWYPGLPVSEFPSAFSRIKKLTKAPNLKWSNTSRWNTKHWIGIREPQGKPNCSSDLNLQWSTANVGEYSGFRPLRNLVSSSRRKLIFTIPYSTSKVKDSSFEVRGRKCQHISARTIPNFLTCRVNSLTLDPPRASDFMLTQGQEGIFEMSSHFSGVLVF